MPTAETAPTVDTADTSFPYETTLAFTNELFLQDQVSTADHLKHVPLPKVPKVVYDRETGEHKIIWSLAGFLWKRYCFMQGDSCLTKCELSPEQETKIPKDAHIVCTYLLPPPTRPPGFPVVDENFTNNIPEKKGRLSLIHI